MYSDLHWCFAALNTRNISQRYVFNNKYIYFPNYRRHSSDLTKLFKLFDFKSIQYTCMPSFVDNIFLNFHADVTSILKTILWLNVTKVHTRGGGQWVSDHSSPPLYPRSPCLLQPLPAHILRYNFSLSPLPTPFTPSPVPSFSVPRALKHRTPDTLSFPPYTYMWSIIHLQLNIFRLNYCGLNIFIARIYSDKDIYSWK